jgi:hypothetical protein
MLHELPAPVSLLHPLLSEGTELSALLVSTCSETLLRLFTKSRRKMNIQQKACRLPFNVCSTTSRPPINPLVSTAFDLDESDHRTDNSSSRQAQLS